MVKSIYFVHLDYRLLSIKPLVRWLGFHRWLKEEEQLESWEWVFGDSTSGLIFCKILKEFQNYLKSWHQVLVGGLWLLVDEWLGLHQESKQVHQIQLNHIKEVGVDPLDLGWELRVCKLLKKVDQEPFEVWSVLFWVDIGLVNDDLQISFNHRNSFVHNLNDFVHQYLGHVQQNSLIHFLFIREACSGWRLDWVLTRDGSRSHLFGLLECFRNALSKLRDSYFSLLPLCRVHHARSGCSIVRD